MSVLVIEQCVGCQEDADEFDSERCDNCGKLSHPECGRVVDLPIAFAGNFECVDCAGSE